MRLSIFAFFFDEIKIRLDESQEYPYSGNDIDDSSNFTQISFWCDISISNCRQGDYAKVKSIEPAPSFYKMKDYSTAGKQGKSNDDNRSVFFIKHETKK